MRHRKSLKLTMMTLETRSVGLVLLGVTGVLLASLLGACTQPDGGVTDQQKPLTAEFDLVKGEVDTEVAPETIATREPRECPELDSRLYQLSQADSPPATAEKLGFRVKDEKVQVLLVLMSEDVGFLQDFGVELGTQSGLEVQAFVPFDRLCDLANMDAVLAIRPPARAIP